MKFRSLPFVNTLGFFALLAFFVIASCGKDPDPVVPSNPGGGGDPPVDTVYFTVEGITVSNGVVIEVGFTDVKIRADFSNFEVSTFSIVDYGHVVSKTNTRPTQSSNDGLSSLGEGASQGTFNSVITGLESGTTYFARVYLKRDDGTYSYHPNSISFTTKSTAPPTVLDTLDGVLSNSALLRGRIADFKGEAVSDFGFIWSTIHSTNGELTIAQNEGKISLGGVEASEGHSFAKQITGLTPSTTYYARAYAVNSTGPGYSPILSFVTLDAPSPFMAIDTFYLVSDTNNSGDVNPGENVTFSLALKNVGEATAQNVQLTLLSNNVLPTSQSIDYQDIPAGNSVNKFVSLETAGNLAAGDDFVLLAEMTSNNGGPWTNATDLIINIELGPRPDLIVKSISLADDANNSGSPNPGEAVTYNVTIENNGELSAVNTEVKFISERINPNPVLQSYGTIVPNGGQATESIDFALSSDLSAGDVFIIEVEMNSGNYETMDGNTFTIEVSASPEPNLICLGANFLNDANGSGGPNPGEQVSYSLQIRNDGPAVAENVEVQISSTEISPNNLSEPFGNIAPGETITESIEFQLSGSTTVGQLVQLALNMSADGGFAWSNNNCFSFVVEAPPAPTIESCGFNIIFDGNNSGTANPGETITYEICLTNTGDLDASNVTANFFSTELEILSPLPISFGNLLIGQTKKREIEVKIPDNAIWGSLLDLNTNIGANSGAYTTGANNFSIEVTSPYVVSDGLLFYLPFDDCSSNQTADVIGQHLGTLSSTNYSTDVVPGSNGCSMSFSANDQSYLEFSHNPFFNLNNVSFSIWLKTTATNFTIFTASSILQQANVLRLSVQNGSWYTPPVFYFDDYDITNALNGQWHHFVLTFNDAMNATALYVDGTLVGTENTGNVITGADNGTGSFIGRKNLTSTNGNNYFDGKMDNFRIYNRALSATEVQTIYDAKQ